MSKMVFYRQKRLDGGIHSGISTDKWPALENYEPGKDDLDPVLNWFVDVRVRGKNLPRRSEDARAWFLDHADFIRGGLRNLAEEVRAGLDFGSWPLQQDVPEAPDDTQVQIVCSVKDRADALGFAKVLKDIAKNWTAYLMSLKPETDRLEISS